MFFAPVLYCGFVGEMVPELPEPEPPDGAGEGVELKGEELVGELPPKPEPEPEPEEEPEPEPNPELTPPPKTAALAFICSIRGS